MKNRYLSLLIIALFTILRAYATPNITQAKVNETSTNSQADAKLDESKARALVNDFAKNQDLDLSRYAIDEIKIRRSTDGKIYWRVDYKKILRKDELVVSGTEYFFFLVDDDSQMVKLLPTF